MQGHLFRAAFLKRVPLFMRNLSENLALCLVASAIEATSKHCLARIEQQWQRRLTERIHADYFENMVRNWRRTPSRWLPRRRMAQVALESSTKSQQGRGALVVPCTANALHLTVRSLHTSAAAPDHHTCGPTGAQLSMAAPRRRITSCRSWTTASRTRRCPSAKTCPSWLAAWQSCYVSGLAPPSTASSTQSSYRCLRAGMEGVDPRSPDSYMLSLLSYPWKGFRFGAHNMMLSSRMLI